MKHNPNFIVQTMNLLAAGNPGAMTVVGNLSSYLLNDNDGLLYYLGFLVSKGIYGSILWVAYKDFCNYDIKEFKNNLDDADSKMFQFAKDCEKGRAFRSDILKYQQLNGFQHNATIKT